MRVCLDQLYCLCKTSRYGLVDKHKIRFLISVPFIIQLVNQQIFLISRVMPLSMLSSKRKLSEVIIDRHPIDLGVNNYQVWFSCVRIIRRLTPTCEHSMIILCSTRVEGRVRQRERKRKRMSLCMQKKSKHRVGRGKIITLEIEQRQQVLEIRERRLDVRNKL